MAVVVPLDAGVDVGVDVVGVAGSKMNFLKNISRLWDIPQLPMILQWHLTERCNLSCSHCYQEHDRGEFPARMLPQILEQMLELLAWRRRESGKRMRGLITLTGGEPFLYRHLDQLLESIVEIGKELRFAILTNGSLIDRSTARFLARLDPAFIQVSLEGPQWLHDRIRGPASFDGAVTGIRHLVGEGIRVVVSFTAHHRNAAHFDDVVRIGCELGVHRIWADRLVSMGRGKELRTLDPSATRQFFSDMAEARTWAIAQGYSTEIAMHRALQFLVGGGAPYHCCAGESLLTVLADGSVVPCRRLPVIVGNVMSSSLVDIDRTSTFLNRLCYARTSPTGCQACLHVRRCRGGARCLACAAHKDPFTADPGCWLASTHNGS